MGDFQVHKNVNKTRKIHTCEHCCKKISIGSSAETASGIFEGDAYRWYVHVMCNVAAVDWHDLTGRQDDEYTWLRDEEDVEDLADYLLESHPEVAVLMGFTDMNFLTRLAKIKALGGE